MRAPAQTCLAPPILALGLATGSAVAQAAEDPVTGPSGFDVTAHEVLFEENPYSGETMVIVRLHAPAIASPVLAANLQADMEWACARWGLPISDQLGTPADRIVVELMAQVVPRGQAALGTRRFFETFSPQDGLCIWELF